ncbi:MAG: toxin-antitoxin system HicB family antitoxin [Myxococcota bacterium]
MAKKRGRPKTIEDQKPFVLRLPPDLHRMLRTYAANQGTSMNQIVVEVLQQWWAKNPERRAFERLPDIMTPRDKKK